MLYNTVQALETNMLGLVQSPTTLLSSKPKYSSFQFDHCTRLEQDLVTLKEDTNWTSGMLHIFNYNRVQWCLRPIRGPNREADGELSECTSGFAQK